MAELSESVLGNRMRIHLVRVLRLADRQWGVVARWQLLESGLSPAAISRWVASGRLHRIYPGVYAVGHRSICLEGRLLAAILYGGPGAALSHASAASWWELISYVPDTIHVCSPRQRRSVQNVRVHRTRRFERVMHRRLPLTPVARTLLDLAAVAPFDAVRKAIAEADFKRWLDLDALDAEMGRGHRGAGALRRALALHLPQHAHTRSPLEDLFLDLCRRHRIPLPEVNVRVAGYEVDALWRDARVVVELDGRAAHGTEARMDRDHERDLALRAATYAVQRYSWRQVKTQPELVAADLRRALSVGAASVSGRQG